MIHLSPETRRKTVVKNEDGKSFYPNEHSSQLKSSFHEIIFSCFPLQGSRAEIVSEFSNSQCGFVFHFICVTSSVRSAKNESEIRQIKKRKEGNKNVSSLSDNACKDFTLRPLPPAGFPIHFNWISIYFIQSSRFSAFCSATASQNGMNNVERCALIKMKLLGFSGHCQVHVDGRENYLRGFVSRWLMVERAVEVWAKGGVTSWYL